MPQGEIPNNANKVTLKVEVKGISNENGKYVEN